MIVNDLPKTLTKEEEEEFIELLRKLRNSRMISILFMSRNLNLAKQICDTISILHDGDMVELAKKDELLSNPIHPYGKAFVKAFEKTMVIIKLIMIHRRNVIIQRRNRHSKQSFQVIMSCSILMKLSLIRA